MRRLFIFIISTLLLQTIYADRGIDITNKSSRTALVIGNSNYSTAPLKNPVNDATDMAYILTQKSFLVTLLTDANQRDMKKAIRQFGKNLTKGGVGLFYYAGHGMQVDGINYLIPVGTDIEAEDEIEFSAINANLVLKKMESASNPLNMMFLDACRNNPFERSFRSGSRGLAQMDAPAGSLIAYATAPGSVAADGDGRNGIFTKHLLKAISKQSIELSEVIKTVGAGVQSETGRKQIPWTSSSVTGDFFFIDVKTVVVEDDEVQPEVTKMQKIPSSQIKTKENKLVTTANEEERELWAMVKDSDSIDDLEIFLESYPKSNYKNQANKKIWMMSTKSIDSIKTYLRKNPNSPFKKNADKKIWEFVSADNSIESLKKYLIEYPNSDYEKEADKQMWQLVNSTNSIPHYRSFISDYPDNRFLGFAKLKLANMKKAEQDRLEKENQKKILTETIFDKNTGLMWQRSGNKKMNWQEADNYCRKLSLAGLYNWRLPQKAELLLVLKIRDKLDFASSDYWSSTSYSDSFIWTVNLQNNKVTTILKSENYYVRCVRNEVITSNLPKKETYPNMVLIPAGKFEMGSNKSSDEKPIHLVYLDEFYIDHYEVTVVDYRKCLNSGSCSRPKTGNNHNWGISGRDQHPVNGVNWQDANRYCEYAGKRLPTEAEWEKAATWKSGQKYKYPSGKSSVSCRDAVMANFGDGCARWRTWAVGSKLQEINGTYDMAGNVWEWVSDWYGTRYHDINQNRNPQGPPSGSRRVIRGGSWNDAASYLRGTSRDYSDPTLRINNLGFRCAVSP